MGLRLTLRTGNHYKVAINTKRAFGTAACVFLIQGINAFSAEPLKWNTHGGLQDQTVSLRIEAGPSGKVYYTTNGSPPSPKAGQELVGSIAIARSTVIRAAAFSGATAISPTETRTFIFPEKAATQTGTGFPATWGSNDGKAVPAYYSVKDHPGLADGLRSLPTLALTLEPEDLFGAERGIYANPLKTGAEWERPATLEYFSTNRGEIARVECGVRIQGGWNRRPEESPKHAFRVVFRKKYGPGKWRCRLFDGAAPQAFDELVLRAGCNNSWLHWSGEERLRGDYIRDQWMRDSHRAMGHPAARGEFVHLHLNGLYWGVYNLAERPAEDFAAAHFGGKPGEYDARNSDNILSGDATRWNELFELANAGVSDPARHKAVGELLDLRAFADYMLLNLYGANADWDRASNWYAAARRSPPGKFHFFVWDGERTLEDARANTIAADDDQSPTRLFQKLRENHDFKALLGERARLHLTGDGALTPAKSAERFKRWADRLHGGIVCEAARWGAYRHDVHQYKTGPYEIYTREKHWSPEVRRLLEHYFPQRSEATVQQLREARAIP